MTDKHPIPVSLVLILFLLILIFILPIAMQIHYPNVNIMAVTWIWFYDLESFAWSIVIWQFSTWGVGLVWSFSRFVFIFQIGRYFAGKTTKTRTLALGFLAELQMAIPYYGIMIHSVVLHGFVPYSFLLPTPIFLVIGWLFMRIHPPEKYEQTLDWLDQPR
ncbi:hypothetical protein EU537_10280 [Candidatus Thorarchaeota archaeon]|nr:MAG: hypothetical protein EU537_10280 [Candidatus Thorarchaeota archaeon]